MLSTITDYQERVFVERESNFWSRMRTETTKGTDTVSSLPTGKYKLISYVINGYGGHLSNFCNIHRAKNKLKYYNNQNDKIQKINWGSHFNLILDKGGINSASNI